MEYILQTNKLTKKYKNFRALNGLTMNIPKGSIYGFVGKNGAGKTTLIRLICGLQEPTKGSYTIYGIKNKDRRISHARRRMGAVVETPAIYMDMTAEDNLKQQCLILGIPTYDSIPDILKLVGLENTGNKKAKNFSLGMKQRLGIAVALVGNPDFLVLDEPINGLDPQGIIEIRELILKLNQEYQITVLISSHILDELSRLATVKAVSTKYVKARNEYLTPHTIREIHKVLRNAFNQAVKWELMTRNPVEHATLPKEEHKTRDIWTAEVLLKALEACDDDILRLAINLAFSCSLRMGELLGLTWDCVDISPASIELGQASIFVEKELQRVNREAMADLNGKDILFKFPPTFASTHTALVLKTPKTKTSVRKVFLPKTVAEMLVQRKADIEELKDLFGDEFTDFNLVFCSSNGKPIEGRTVSASLLIKISDLLI